ncbi:MAG: DUF3347 domain-containing protein [Flavobacterium sp.]|uniref:DUF3347 domain-containing protein n=1 Tax=Flavobacterium sp. TaxID=239 RepID=UPI002732E258|nr:DUF3347 domain-containing protein [Flavobacterium sp.]MDP3681020.1 DUF3347 domain-containing protein [Flavobacterium sp.]MDZ4330468.1 DUF3347 domain-containing protein [Flavobacterium sp.]
MKNTILSIITLALVSVSCNQKNKETEADKPVAIKTTSELYSCPMHPEVTGEKGAECSECGMELSEKVAQMPKAEKNDAVTTDVETENTIATTKTVAANSFTINEIVSSYLKLKNALVKDDSKAAANAGKGLYATFEKVNSNTISNVKLKNKYNDIAENAKKNVKHIGDNAGKIDRQREYFALLSKDVHDLIKTFGTDQKLYQDYCPMYNEGKDGYWISETKDVKNPYYGSEMLTCGRMVEAI